MSPFTDQPRVSPKYIFGDNARPQGGSPFARHSTQGYPLRPEQAANGHMLNHREVADLKHSGDFHCQVFDLMIQEELDAYTEIMDRIVNHKAVIFLKYPVPTYDPESQTCKVVLQWVELFAELPANLRPR